MTEPNLQFTHPWHYEDEARDGDECVHRDLDDLHNHALTPGEPVVRSDKGAEFGRAWVLCRAHYIEGHHQPAPLL